MPQVVLARRTSPVRLLFARALVAASMAATTSAAAQEATPPAALPGIYNEEQATKGDGVFSRVCVECHTRKDMTNADFRVKWNGRTVFDLFDITRTTMPDGAAGTLPIEEYAAVTAYMLKLNGYPAGPTALPADSTLKNHKLVLDGAAPPSSSASRSSSLRGVHVVSSVRASRRAPLRPLAWYLAARRDVGAGAGRRAYAGHSAGH